RVIRKLQCLLFRFEGRDDDERPEDLFAVDLHAGLHVGEDGWFDEEPLARPDGSKCFPAGDERRAFFFARFDVAHYAVVLHFCDLWALEGGFSERVAYYGDFLY